MTSFSRVSVPQSDNAWRQWHNKDPHLFTPSEVSFLQSNCDNRLGHSPSLLPSRADHARGRSELFADSQIPTPSRIAAGLTTAGRIAAGRTAAHPSPERLQRSHRRMLSDVTEVHIHHPSGYGHTRLPPKPTPVGQEPHYGQGKTDIVTEGQFEGRRDNNVNSHVKVNNMIPEVPADYAHRSTDLIREGVHVNLKPNYNYDPNPAEYRFGQQDVVRGEGNNMHAQYRPSFGNNIEDWKAAPYPQTDILHSNWEESQGIQYSRANNAGPDPQPGQNARYKRTDSTSIGSTGEDDPEVTSDHHHRKYPRKEAYMQFHNNPGMVTQATQDMWNSQQHLSPQKAPPGFGRRMTEIHNISRDQKHDTEWQQSGRGFPPTHEHPPGLDGHPSPPTVDHAPNSHAYKAQLDIMDPSRMSHAQRRRRAGTPTSHLLG